MLIRRLTLWLAKTPAWLGAAAVVWTAWPSQAAVPVGLGSVQPPGMHHPLAYGAATVVRRPRWIGVMVDAIPPVFSRLLGLKPNQGLLVIQVVPGSPAQQAKLHAGDLLIQINGSPLLTEKQLVAAVNQRVPAETNPPSKSPHRPAPLCRLTLIRNGHRKTISIRPQNRPAHVMMLPDGQLIIANNKTNKAVNHVPPSPMQPMAFGPGVVIHFGPAGHGGPPGPQWTHAVMIRQWIDRRGVRHVLLIFQGKQYPLRPQAISSLPVEIQPLARLIVQHNRRLRVSLTPARIAADIANIQQQMKMLSDQQTILSRQLRWLKRQQSRAPVTPATRP